jgi:hypothetical protein
VTAPRSMPGAVGRSGKDRRRVARHAPRGSDCASSLPLGAVSAEGAVPVRDVDGDATDSGTGITGAVVPEGASDTSSTLREWSYGDRRFVRTCRERSAMAAHPGRSEGRSFDAGCHRWRGNYHNVESLDRLVRKHKTIFIKVSGQDGISRIALVERRAS